MQAVWIEIPVKDIERAMKFYQAVFKLEPTEIRTDEVRRTTNLSDMTQEGRPGISLNQTKNFEPSDKGPLIYVDAGEDLTDHLTRVEFERGQGRGSQNLDGRGRVLRDDRRQRRECAGAVLVQVAELCE